MKLFLAVNALILAAIVTDAVYAMSYMERLSLGYDITSCWFMYTVWENRHNLRRPAQWVSRTRNSSVDILIDSGGYVTESSI